MKWFIHMHSGVHKMFKCKMMSSFNFNQILVQNLRGQCPASRSLTYHVFNELAQRLCIVLPTLLRNDHVSCWNGSLVNKIKHHLLNLTQFIEVTSFEILSISIFPAQHSEIDSDITKKWSVAILQWPSIPHLPEGQKQKQTYKFFMTASSINPHILQASSLN